VKFTRIEIDDYGPLQGFSLQNPGRFNLLFGSNETGKTLAIEAIWKMLWSRYVKKLEGTNRVEENPRGFLRMEVGGKEFRLPDAGNLDALIDMTPDLFRNTFIVRNSDLAIEKEGDFFSQVTSRLTGLKTNEIEKIEEAVLEISSLTGTLKFKDDAGSRKLKTRIDKAERAKEEVSVLLERIERERWDELERDLVWNLEKAQLLERELENLDLSRRREMYEEGKKTSEKLKKISEELSGLAGFSREKASVWRDLNTDLERNQEGLENLQTEEANLEKELEEIKEELEKVETKINRLKKTKTKIDENVLPELKAMEEKEEKFNKAKKSEKLFRTTGKISFLVIVLSLIGPIITPDLLLSSLIMGIVFLLTGGYSWYRVFQLKKEEGEIEAIFTRIKNNLRPFDLEGDKKELVLGIEKIQQEFEEWEGKKGKLDQEKIYSYRRKEEIAGKKRETEEKIKKNNLEIEELKRESGTDHLESYLKNLKRKEELEKEKTHLEYNLRRIFQVRGEVDDWDRVVSEYEEFKDRAKDYDYSSEAVEKREKELGDLKEKQKEMEARLEEFKNELVEIERVLNREIFIEEDFIPCNTSLDLRESKKKLEEFINYHEKNRERAELVLDIFSEIKSEEEEKVSGIFADTKVGDLFSRITGGKYQEVRYDGEAGKIFVRENEGRVLPAEKLSGGAFDQLYLAIRVAMGEKILGENNGFFILDDPFIKADEDRLKRLIETVKNLAGRGWQILYFTCKNEVREILKPAIEKEEVNLFEV